MTLKEYKEQKLKEFEEEFPTHVEISDRPGSFVILRSDREQKELKSFLDKAIEEAWIRAQEEVKTNIYFIKEKDIKVK